MSIRKQFIVIGAMDFKYISRFPETRLRSLENWLEKNKRDFQELMGNYNIEVVNKNEALSIGSEFRLEKINYFDGHKFEVLDLKTLSKKGRPKNIVTVNENGQSFTRRQYSKFTKNEIETNYISKSQIIKLKLLPKTRLEEEILNGNLSELIFKDKIYINKLELKDVILRK